MGRGCGALPATRLGPGRWVDVVRAGRRLVTVQVVLFTHLRWLTDASGLYEHACGTDPRREHGYCVDDVARALVVVCRDAGPEVDDLREQYLSFLLAAQVGDGRFRNRRAADLSWQDEPPEGVPVEDCWGRALWGLGSAVARRSHLSGPALAAFERGARWRSPHPRAMAFAAFGAAEVLRTQPDHRPSRDLLRAAANLIGRPAEGSGWPWPSGRCTPVAVAVTRIGCYETRGSHRALQETITTRLATLAKPPSTSQRLTPKGAAPKRSTPERVAVELAALEDLHRLADTVDAESSAKLTALVDVLRELGVGPGSDERVVVFSERIPTLKWLAQTVPPRLGFAAGAEDDAKKPWLVAAVS